MNKFARILVLGGGLVGSAIVKILKEEGFKNFIWMKTRKHLDLIIQSEVNSYFLDVAPDYVFLTAAKVGGILANNLYKADFIYKNLMIQSNVINACYNYNVKKLLFLGSSCIYSKNSIQPIKEEYLLTGPLEETNDAYAIAKIAGLKMCQSYNEQYGTNFLCVMPTNLYGPNDTYNLENSHVIPSLIMKAHSSKINNKPLVVWGSGNVFREFLYSEDLARDCVFLMKNCDYEDVKPFINIGFGEDILIKDLVKVICKIVGFTGEIVFDMSNFDGVMRKRLDLNKYLKIFKNESSRIPFYDGISNSYNDYLRRFVLNE
jgi:GDP-L-fucose synthase